MVKLEVITIVIFLLGTCLCQSTVPCVDLVDGREVGTGGFSDPTYFNGQSLGQYNRSVMSQVNGELLEQMDFNFTGISWWWDSRSYGTTTPIPAPVLRHKLPAELSYDFASYFAPSINGELFTEDTFTRACGADNETLVNGPGQFKPQETGSWQFFHMKPYNITFWRQLYVPKGPSANWARMVHFIQADQDTEINYWTYSTFVWTLKTLFAHPQSVPTRYQIYTDLDQVTYLRMPTAINYMGKNGRVIVTGADSLDCYSLHTSAAPFKLKAGETVAFAYFASLGFDDNKAVSTAQWIDSQPAEAFAKLTNDELSQIMNWDACAAVLGPQVTVKVDQSDKCSKTPQFTIALTTSLSYTSTHRVIRADGSVAQSVSDTSFTMSESGTFTLETWMNNCVVKRTPFDVVINDATFDTNTQTITGSNEPFTFKYDSQTKTLTATDTHGCETEAVLGTSTVSNTAFIAVDIVARMIFAALTLLL